MRKNYYPAKLSACFIPVFLIISLWLPSSVFAQVPEEWGKIEETTGRCVTSDGVATIQGFECIFTNITRILVPIVGLLLFIMLIIGSLQLMTAGGEAKAVQKARATITSAIFGLVLFFGIWFILLLIKEITGIDVTKFAIPGP